MSYINVRTKKIVQFPRPADVEFLLLWKRDGDQLFSDRSVRATAERAALYEESRRAQMSAVGNGWRPLDPDMLLWICPRCIDRARAHTAVNEG